MWLIEWQTLLCIPIALFHMVPLSMMTQCTAWEIRLPVQRSEYTFVFFSIRQHVMLSLCVHQSVHNVVAPYARSTTFRTQDRETSHHRGIHSQFISVIWPLYNCSTIYPTFLVNVCIFLVYRLCVIPSKLLLQSIHSQYALCNTVQVTIVEHTFLVCFV